MSQTTRTHLAALCAPQGAVQPRTRGIVAGDQPQTCGIVAGYQPQTRGIVACDQP